MRQGQQNRRGRGRGRKVQNPLARNFESNGPDVKIRGTAAHIAEKYTALARDAAASGDSVTAENYLQHAEHYNRIIMAAQAQMQSSVQQAGDGSNGAGGQRYRRPGQDDIARIGSDAIAFGDDVDEAADGPRLDEVMTTSGRRQDDGGRRRANGAGEEHAEEQAGSAEDAPDNATA